MKKLIGIFTTLLLAMTSCSHQEPTSENDSNEQLKVDPKQEFAKLNTFMQKFEEPSQVFKLPSDKIIKVTGKQGTIIRIDPADLEMENGQPIGKHIKIELKELSNRQQLLRANAQTISDGQLLISGGAFFINASSGGQKIKLKKGKTYSAEFPKLSDDEMQLYYGHQDSSGSMNWKQTDKKFADKKEPIKKSLYSEMVLTKSKSKDTIRTELKKSSKAEVEKMKKEAAMDNKLYQAIDLDQFGWINCDRFFDPNAPRTNLQFAIENNADEVNFAKVYLIFNNVKSVVQSNYFVEGNTIEKKDFTNVPVGSSVRIFAVSYYHEKIFALLTEPMKVTQNQNEKLLLKEVNEATSEKLLKAIE